MTPTKPTRTTNPDGTTLIQYPDGHYTLLSPSGSILFDSRTEALLGGMQ